MGHDPEIAPPGPLALGRLDRISFAIEEGPFVDGDVVVGRWRGRGETADGPAEFVGHDILRCSGGEFVEYWALSAPATPV